MFKVLYYYVFYIIYVYGSKCRLSQPKNTEILEF